MYTPPKIILCDMDEVLTDFVGAACRAHGFSRKEFEARRTPGVWDMNKPLGIENYADFWRPIKAQGHGFWEHLRPHVWFHELIQLIVENCDDWFILTTPNDDPRCRSGKYSWLKKNLPKHKHRLIATGDKWLLSQKNRVLIDDKEENLIQFEYVDSNCTIARGGMGILFPSAGNCLHGMQFDPIPYIRTQLDAFKIQKRKRRISPLTEVLCV